ncbi:ABC transporter permease [Desulfococcaceae bacterium OttesenSCG-928-F15]|nr:ABC transporter permease [Desulfococcaceae bacterium OttesenSCG-928-F15]
MILSNTRMRAQIIKELLSILRDKRSRMILIVPPLMQLLLFAFAVTLDVRNITIVAHNRDSGKWGSEVLHKMEAANFVKKIIHVDNPGALHEAIEKRKALIAVQIPEDFSRKIASGATGKVQAIADGRRANSGQVALGYLERIVSTVSARAQGREGQEEIIALRHWFNPNQNYKWFVVPGLSGILAMFISLLTSALSIARERELGTFDQLLVSPGTPTEIIISKTVPSFIVGSSLFFFMFLMGMLFFSVPFKGSLLPLVLALLVFILSMVGIGLMISAVCVTQQQAILGVFVIIVPVILMSGFATPVENMPVFLQYMAEFIPLKHFLIIIHGSFLRAMPVSEVMRNLWPILLIALANFTMATILVRSRLR